MSEELRGKIRKGAYRTGFSKEELKVFSDWLQEVVDQGLYPANDITSEDLVRDFGDRLGKNHAERMYYARQLVDDFIKTIG